MTLDQYDAMVESGVFGDRAKFYLVNGMMAAKITQKDPHCTADILCRDELMRVVSAGWHVRSDKPVTIPPNSKPEPDQYVARRKARDYSVRSPGALDVAVVVEIAAGSRSVRKDRKMALIYGAGGIPVYCIVDHKCRRVEVHSLSGANGYGKPRVFKAGQSVPVVIGGKEVGQIAVADILP